MSEKKYQYIELQKKGKICILKLNRPEKKNAMHKDMRNEIIDALETMKTQDRIKCIIFYGGHDFFSAGFDRNEVQSVVMGKGNIEDFAENNILFHRTILHYPKLTIAAITGYALAGAFDLAIICHLRIGANDSYFGHPEIKFGACPLFFPYMSIVGRGKALEIALNTGTKEQFLDAKEAYRLNLLNNIVKPDSVLDTSIKMAKQILKSPDLTISQLIKVSNGFFDQAKAFDKEVEIVMKTMKL